MTTTQAIPGYELPEGTLAIVNSTMYQGSIVTRHGRDLHSVCSKVAFTIYGGGAKPEDKRNEVIVKPIPKGTAFIL